MRRIGRGASSKRCESRRADAEKRCSRWKRPKSRVKEVLLTRVDGGAAHGSARARRRVVSGASRAGHTLMTLS